MNELKKKLLIMIDSLVSNHWDVETFEKNYYEFYTSYNLTIKDNEFFSEIHQKLDWTAKSLSEEDRLCGWLNHEEYIEWVKKEIALFE